MRNTLKKISAYVPSPWGSARVGVLFLLLPFTFYAQTNTFPASGNVGIVPSSNEKPEVKGSTKFIRLTRRVHYHNFNYYV